MKICLTATDKNLDSKLHSRFGRCDYFLIYDSETKEYYTLENDPNLAHGAGVNAAQRVVDENIDVLITGNLGPNAKEILLKAEIKCYKGEDKELKRNINLFKEDKLSNIC
ncbi:MAG: diguanylate cyclase [Firmicutes bacterium]|nr:diguanylate cyclase [Bacillota bacterium]